MRKCYSPQHVTALLIISQLTALTLSVRCLRAEITDGEDAFSPVVTQIQAALEKNASPSELSKLCDLLPEGEAANWYHLTVLKEPLQYQRPGYLEMLRTLAAYSLAKEVPESKQLHAKAVQCLRAVVLFDKHSGYVDGAITTGANVTFRRPRSIACRLQALRTLEAIVPVAEQASICTQAEVDRAVFEYNPTYVAGTRSDAELKVFEGMTLSQRYQTTLYTALLHFPDDPETIELLDASVRDYRDDPVHFEAQLATLVGIFSYHFIRATAHTQQQFLSVFEEKWLTKVPPSELQSPLLKSAVLFRDWLIRIRLADFRYLPPGWDKENKVSLAQLLAGLSRSRQEALNDCSFIGERLLSIRIPEDAASLTNELTEALYLRSNWVVSPPISLEESETQAAKLRYLGQRFVFYYEQAMGWQEYFPAEDKAQLCHRLLIFYDCLSPQFNGPEYDEAIGRLRNLLFGWDSNSYYGTVRQAILSWLVYEAYKDRKTNMIDFQTYEMRMKNPPEKLMLEASKRVEGHQRIFLETLNRLSKKRLRLRDRYALFRKIGFHISLLAPLFEQELKLQETAQPVKKG